MIMAAALLGFTAMFLRLFDALVSTPNRIRSQFPIQATTHNAPPSSLPANTLPRNNTNFKGKQVHFLFNAYVFTEGNSDTAGEAYGYGRKWLHQMKDYDKLVFMIFWKDETWLLLKTNEISLGVILQL
ncbi:hypothetical protein V6N11_052722 [Hibiscus sabdariffa]|uniref:Uncharacterized protein n=1 Tax=Hibiscus sabdariffa TaxID=183260 RepID=A0ABR2UBN0_9ROSI